MKVITLRDGKDRSLLRRHPWVFQGSVGSGKADAGETVRIESKEELRPAMEKAFALKDRLVFMDIVVDPHEHVYPMHIAPGSLRDMWLSKTERT